MTLDRIETLLPPEGITFLRADSYRLPKEGSPGYVEAEPGTPWRSSAPTASYKPAGKAAELEAGPHLDFLRLKTLLENDRRSFDEKLVTFANEYGLLGLFRENHDPAKLPGRRLWVAPEAVVGADRTLQRVDPAQEGTELLLDLLDRQGYFAADGSKFGRRDRARESARSRVAMPSEVAFVRRSYRGPWRGDPTGHDLEPEAISWEEAREPYGGLLVLTKDTSTRARVLCTREHTEHWRTALMDFPSGSLRPDDDVLRAVLNSRLTRVSPYAVRNEDRMDRGWRCSSLLEAMYLMLWLDMTGGRSLVKCRSTGCPNWFRRGSQPDSMYCPHPEIPGKTSPCALREAKRASRRRQAAKRS
jgi:hypothetical protein